MAPTRPRAQAIERAGAATTVAMVAEYHAEIGRRLAALADDVLADVAAVIPPGALVQIVRGVAVGMTLADALPNRRPRLAGAQTKVTRQVVVDALRALAEQHGHGEGGRRGTARTRVRGAGP